MSLMSAKIGQLLVDGTDGASVIRHTTDLIKNLRHALKGMIQDSDWLGKGKQSSSINTSFMLIILVQNSIIEYAFELMCQSLY